MLSAATRWLFDPSGLTPHGFCLLWNTGLIWTHALADLIVGLAYFSIPVSLAVVVRQRRDLVFRPVLILCAAFILLCGTGHWLALLTLWVPVYGVEGAVKAATAAVSLVTAVALWRLLPRVLALPSPAQLRQVNAALHETNAQLKMAEQIACVGHWRIALPDRTVHWSTQVFRIFGLDPAGMPPSLPEVLEHYHPEDRMTTELNLERAIGAGRSYTMQSRIVLANGEVRFLESRGVPEWDSSGQLAALFGVVMDKTDHHRAEEIRAQIQSMSLRAEAALEASQAKSRFLASMSHELRTPLNGVLGYAQLLRMGGGLNATQMLQVDAMINAGGHLLQMISRVLDFSEIEAEHVSLESADIDPRALAQSCLDLVRPAAEEKQLAVSLRAADEVPQTIRVDAMRLRQILLNLLGNAVKFTGKGAVALTLAVRDAAQLRMEVIDTGPGISAEQRHRLFQDFERLGEVKNSAIEGAGLGLAISMRLVALMGGTLGHDGNPGGGSIFRVDLPLVTTADMPGPAMRADVPSACQADRRLRVLVVDDVAMNRDITRAFLVASGHHATVVESGTLAIAAVNRTAFDVVLMDVQMPGLSGLEATRRIRASPGPNNRVPIVALTAQAFAGQVEDCLHAGMNTHLAKPFTPASLDAALLEAIGSKQSFFAKKDQKTFIH